MWGYSVASEDLGRRPYIFMPTQLLLKCEYMYQPLFIFSERNIVLNASSEAIYFRNKHYQLKKLVTRYITTNEAPKRLFGEMR